MGTTMDATLCAYLAGVIDSDGYITIKRSTYALRVLEKPWHPQYQEMVGLKQTQPEVVDILKAEFGGYRGTERPTAKRGKLLHVWQGTNVVAVSLLRLIRPYLKLKVRQADLAFLLRDSKESREARLRGSPAKLRQVQAVIAERDYIFAQIRDCNDTRPRQAKLGGA